MCRRRADISMSTIGEEIAFVGCDNTGYIYGPPTSGKLSRATSIVLVDIWNLGLNQAIPYVLTTVKSPVIAENKADGVTVNYLWA